MVINCLEWIFVCVHYTLACSVFKGGGGTRTEDGGRRMGIGRREEYHLRGEGLGVKLRGNGNWYSEKQIAASRNWLASHQRRTDTEGNDRSAT